MKKKAVEKNVKVVSAKKAVAKKAVAKKTVAKKATARKAVAKKTVAKKVVAKSTASKAATETAKAKAAKTQVAKSKVAKTKTTKKTAVKKVAVGKAVLSKPGTLSKSKVADVDLNFIGSKEESAETRTIASRKRVRTKLDSEVEAFLSSGGKIDSVAPNVMADPPRKPESNYGSRPI